MAFCTHLALDKRKIVIEKKKKIKNNKWIFDWIPDGDITECI